MKNLNTKTQFWRMRPLLAFLLPYLLPTLAQIEISFYLLHTHPGLRFSFAALHRIPSHPYHLDWWLVLQNSPLCFLLSRLQASTLLYPSLCWYDAELLMTNTESQPDWYKDHLDEQHTTFKQANKEQNRRLQISQIKNFQKSILQIIFD